MSTQGSNKISRHQIMRVISNKITINKIIIALRDKNLRVELLFKTWKQMKKSMSISKTIREKDMIKAILNFY